MKKEASAAPAEEKPRPLFRLKLDHDEVYFGCEPFEGIAGASDVVLDHAPDNPPGIYRWSREHRRFEPLPKEKQKDAPEAPTLEQAFYAFVKFGADNPIAKAWCDWFEKSLEGPES
jgi:hypothetical protein